MSDGPANGARPDRSVPHSIEAEEAVLGSILINPEALFDVIPFLRSEDFYLVRHQRIWDAILALHDRREPVDFLTVVEELERRGQLEEIGGSAYITSLINAVPTAIHAEAYGRIVERTALRRRLIEAAGEIAKIAYEDASEVDEVVDRAESTLFNVTQRRLAKELVPIKQVISEYYDRIQYLYDHRGEMIGVPTGFIDLDRLLGGLQKSDLIIVAGRPGTGKTSFLLTTALNAARKFGQRIAIFSLEMSAEQLVQRLISAETGIDSQRLRLGDLKEEEWPLFVQATSRLAETRIFIDDTPSISALQLRTKCRRLYAEYGLDLIIVDYLQLMTGDVRAENRVQEISYISRNLKALARELDVPVLAAAQLSRAVEQRQDKRPMLSDLRESGCLTGDSLVTLADSGANVPFRELVGQSGFRIWALNPQTLKLEAMPVSRVFSTGVKPVFRLTTRLGRTIRATANHQFLTIHGWRRLDELRVGDYLAVPRFLSSGSQQSMTDAELALLGHLIGDGCTLPTHALQYTTHEKDLAEMVASLAGEVFGDEVNPRIVHERHWYQVYLASTRQHTHRVHSAVTDWLRGLGIWGLRSHEKLAPEKVFQQPSSAIAHFLRHLWATDGSIQLVKGKKVRPIAYYTSSSAMLAKDVQSLLLRLGINARLQRVSQNGKGRDQYHVIVTGKPDLEKFASSIGAVGEYRQRRLAEVIAYLQEHPANTNRDIIPHDIWRMYVIPAMARAGLTARQMQVAIGTNYCGTGLYKQNVSRERASRVAYVVNSDELATLADSDIYWDRIDAIEPDVAEEVFDLTVPGHHNFVVNNIIAHNSIEQDSDVVMFIYREDLYNPDTERKNIAEIHVAKHRNGPTGSVDLYFRSHLTQFANLMTREVSL